MLFPYFSDTEVICTFTSFVLHDFSNSKGQGMDSLEEQMIWIAPQNLDCYCPPAVAITVPTPVTIHTTPQKLLNITELKKKIRQKKMANPLWGSQDLAPV